MRLMDNGQALTERLEFGTGLRMRVERARAISRARTKGKLAHLVVPGSLHLVVPDVDEESDGRDDGRDEAFELLLELSRKVDGRENLNLGHSRTIAVLSRNLARALGVDEDGVQRAYFAGMFHDLGKLELPETLLRKPGPLSQREWAEMASHAERGANMIDRIGGLREVAEIVAAHHERWDGVGYPNRIAGEAIPLEARIVSASDAFVTMTSERPFRSALPVTAAITELIRNAGSGYDPVVVGALLELAVERGLGTSAMGSGAARQLAAAG